MRIRKDVLVVVPAFNEAPSVASVVASIKKLGWKVLVVDDGSVDATAREARRAGAVVATHATNLGVGAALRTGFTYAVQHGYSRVVQCDADGQHRAELIDYLVSQATMSGADLVIGSRFLVDVAGSMQVASHRRLAMRWLSWLLLRKTGVRVHDTTSGFKCVSEPLLSEFASSFPAHFLGDTFESCFVAARYGYSVVEVPVVMDERAHGFTSASSSKSVQYIIRSVAAAAFGLTFKVNPKSSVTAKEGVS